MGATELAVVRNITVEETNSISQKKGKKTHRINQPCSNQVILHIIKSFMRPSDIKHSRSQV